MKAIVGLTGGKKRQKAIIYERNAANTITYALTI